MATSTIHPGMASVYQMNQGATSNLNPKVNGATGNGADGADADPYTVELSQEAQGLMAEESQGGDGASAMIDIAIEKIKEQIKAVKEQLDQLKNVEGEAADAQREMLTEQLVTLTAKLMDLMTQKLEMQG